MRLECNCNLEIHVIHFNETPASARNVTDDLVSTYLISK